MFPTVVVDAKCQTEQEDDHKLTKLTMKDVIYEKTCIVVLEL